MKRLILLLLDFTVAILLPFAWLCGLLGDKYIDFCEWVERYAVEKP